jgi:hypothetical protein
MTKYRIINFNGEVACCKLLDGTYIVDPEFLTAFLTCCPNSELILEG